MIERLRRLSPRAEKTIRLVLASAIGALFGITGVVRDDETLGWIGAGIVLAAILAGPLVNRALTGGGEA